MNKESDKGKMSWCYGFIENEDGLMLSEIYFDIENDDKIIGYCYVDWKDLDEEMLRNNVIDDLKSQLKMYGKYNFEEKNITNKEDFKPLKLCGKHDLDKEKQ